MKRLTKRAGGRPKTTSPKEEEEEEEKVLRRKSKKKKYKNHNEKGCFLFSLPLLDSSFESKVYLYANLSSAIDRNNQSVVAMKLLLQHQQEPKQHEAEKEKLV